MAKWYFREVVMYQPPRQFLRFFQEKIRQDLSSRSGHTRVGGDEVEKQGWPRPRASAHPVFPKNLF